MDIVKVPNEHIREAASLREDIYLYLSKAKNTNELIVMAEYLQFQTLEMVAYFTKCLYK